MAQLVATIHILVDLQRLHDRCGEEGNCAFKVKSNDDLMVFVK